MARQRAEPHQGSSDGVIPPDVRPVYRLRTAAAAGASPDGWDSTIVSVPPQVWVEEPGGVIDLPTLLRFLHTAAQQGADTLGERLHHADWLLTTDPALVDRIGTHGSPACPTCRAGADQALARLAERPGEPLAVGVLTWAGR